MAETSKRGFASMDPSKQREIASKGGRAAHAKGTAHEFTTDEARQAGKKGGESVSRNREHMSAIGRRGGERRGMNRQNVETMAASGRNDRQGAQTETTRFESSNRGDENRNDERREM
jgi:general stress protein YciG